MRNLGRPSRSDFVQRRKSKGLDFIRHTFCTNMANAGMDIKTLQYVMGHSDVGVTLNVYTHASYDRAAEQMAKILDFKEKETDIHEKRRKSG